MGNSDIPGPIWTSAEGSMAQATAKTRWPKIVQDMIHDIQQTVNERMSEKQLVEQGAHILEGLTRLQEDLTGNKDLVSLTGDSFPDIAGYNSLMKSFGRMTWQDCPWLFAECYLYRRVHGLVTSQPAWQNYDIFARQKLSSLVASKTAVEELSAKYSELSASNAFTTDSAAGYAIFAEMTEIALWGNAIDLSLLTSISPENIKAIQGTKAITRGRSRIVGNDMAATWAYLKANRGKVVDVVLDNAGFELFTDLLYSLYLLDTGLATTIRLHVKAMPWFVSDVNSHDIPILISTLEDTSVFGGLVWHIAGRLRKCFDDGKVRVEERSFWTTAYDFQDISAVDPELLADLREAALVVFKGDLNYRKLVRDATWPHATPFKEALGVLGTPCGGDTASAIKILALRTNKSDVCVGLDGATVECLETEAPGGAWVRNGKYAVVQLSV